MNRTALASLLLLALTRPTSAELSTAAVQTLQAADVAYLNRLDDQEARQALNLYEEVIVGDPGNVEALVKGAKAAWWVADHTPAKKEKLNVFQKGIDFSKKAIELDPKSAAAHFWLAGNYGSYGEARGVLKSLFLVKPIRRELEEVLKIDPSFEKGGAYRVLGVVDYKVPGFAGGNRKRAEEQLTKALELGPNDAFNLYYMAEYFVTVGNMSKAAEFLDRLDQSIPPSEEKPDWVMMTEKGKTLRAKIKK